MRGTRREILTSGVAATWLITTPALALERSLSDRIILNGLALHVWRHPGARPGSVPVIYVHGATFPSSLAVGWRFDDGESWADDLVRSGYDLWSFDFLGYGKSDRYPAMASPAVEGPLGRCEMAVRQLSAVVERVCATTGKPRVALLAHSWGTMVAARFAAENPAQVDRLVLFGPILRRKDGDASGVSRLRGWDVITPAAQLARFREDVPRGQPELITDPMFAPWGAAYLESDAGSASRQPQAVAVPNGPLADILAARAGTLPYDPALITCPVSIVRGEWDSRVTDADVARFKAELIHCPSTSDAKLEHGTHLMHLETGRHRLWAAVRNALSDAKRAPVDTHAVIFEVRPSKEGREDYLATARALRLQLDEIDGFVSIERFQSTVRPGWILSLSLWADELAIAAWRSRERHHAAQRKGRSGTFEDYRLRVAHMVFDNGEPASRQPRHSSAYRDPSRRRVDHLALIETVGEVPAGLVPMLRPSSTIRKVEAFASLSTPEKLLHLVEFSGTHASKAWSLKVDDRAGREGGKVRVRTLEVLRDYGMFDRAEAPQFHSPAQGVKASA